MIFYFQLCSNSYQKYFDTSVCFNTSKASGKKIPFQLRVVFFEVKERNGCVTSIAQSFCLTKMRHVSSEWALENTVSKFAINKWQTNWSWILLCSYHHVGLCIVTFPAWKNSLNWFIQKSCAADVYIIILHVRRELFSYTGTILCVHLFQKLPCLNGIFWVGAIHHRGLCHSQDPQRGQFNYKIWECCKAQSGDYCAFPFY